MFKTYKHTRLRKLFGRLLGYEQEIRVLASRIRELQWDTTFGMWNRTAFIQICSVMPRGERVIAFIDLDDIHGLNRALGYTEVDRRIRNAFTIRFRASDIVARWYSGDEIVILFDSDLQGARTKIRELERSAEDQGLSFVCELGIWSVGLETVVAVVDRLADGSRALQVANGSEKNATGERGRS